MAVLKTKVNGQWVEVPVVAQEMNMVAQKETNVTLVPNTYNKWESPITTLTLANPTFEGTDEYVLDFTTGDTVEGVTLSSALTFAKNFKFKPNTHYIISIVNNLAVGGAF